MLTFNGFIKHIDCNGNWAQRKNAAKRIFNIDQKHAVKNAIHAFEYAALINAASPRQHNKIKETNANDDDGGRNEQNYAVCGAYFTIGRFDNAGFALGLFIWCWPVGLVVWHLLSIQCLKIQHNFGAGKVKLMMTAALPAVGSTGVACIELGRRFIGIEENEAYFEILVGRLRPAVAERDVEKWGDENDEYGEVG